MQRNDADPQRPPSRGRIIGCSALLGLACATLALAGAHLRSLPPADPDRATLEITAGWSEPTALAIGLAIVGLCVAAGAVLAARWHRVAEATRSLRSLQAETRSADERREQLAAEIASLEAQRQALHDELASTEQALAAARNALDEQRSEARRRQLRALQNERLASLSSLIAGITHELNNPLAVISGFSELLQSQVDRDSELYEMVQAIHTEARRCARIVHNLMTFARERHPTLTPLDLGELVRDALELFRYKFSVDDVQLTCEFEPRLPSVLGDVSQLQQVMLHLFSHAHEALREAEGERSLWLRTRHDPERGTVHFELEHTGRGVDETTLLHLFEPFHSGTGEPDAEGLGLALCYGLVKEHHGELEAENRPGGGMRFTVTLPAGETRRSPTPPDVARRRALARGRGVLIVDDEPGVQGLLQRALSAEGYRCATASNGQEALTLLRSGAFDLVVADLRMPKLGGAAFCASLRREFPELAERTIFTSADPPSAAEQRALEGFPNPMLRKPFEVEQLLNAVAEAAARLGPTPSEASPALI